MPIDSEVFLQEAAELLESLESDLLTMEAEGPDPERIDSVFRALHTLKGSGGMFNFTALARFVHGLENAFDLARAGKADVDATLLKIAITARDHIGALVETRGEPAREAELEKSPAALALQEQISAWIARNTESETADARNPETDSAAELESGEEEKTFNIWFAPHASALRNGTRPDLLIDDLRTFGHGSVTCNTERVPPLEEIDPARSYLAWEIMLKTRGGRQTIDDAFIFSDPEEVTITEAMPENSDVAAAPGSPSETKPSSAGLERKKPSDAPRETVGASKRPEPGNPGAIPSTQRAESVRVQASRLDELMDQIGELVIAHSRLNQLSGTIGEPLLSGTAEEIERLVTSLRETTLSIRMLPIELVFGKFKRVVRDLAGELGKDVQLVSVGGETEVDKNVIDSLTEPLVHIVRNAIDHGIESAKERGELGKSERAVLQISARQSAGEVHISVSDDGRGLDLGAIKARAIDRGLIAEGEDSTDAELSALIFHPGFSTSQTVTNISGRGVGMDAVRRVVQDLRGSVDVTSRAGEGTTITLRLPLTLAIIDGLMVRVAGSIFVIPLSNVEECVELGQDEGRSESGRTLLSIRDELVPYIDLATHFEIGAPPAERPRVVVVGTESRRIGVVVDDILGQHQTVIKSLSLYHRTLPGLAGATILGDGAVALIIDIPDIVKTLGERMETAA